MRRPPSSLESLHCQRPATCAHPVPEPLCRRCVVHARHLCRCLVSTLSNGALSRAPQRPLASSCAWPGPLPLAPHLLRCSATRGNQAQLARLCKWCDCHNACSNHLCQEPRRVWAPAPWSVEVSFSGSASEESSGRSRRGVGASSAAALWRTLRSSARCRPCPRSPPVGASAPKPGQETSSLTSAPDQIRVPSRASGVLFGSQTI